MASPSSCQGTGRTEVTVAECTPAQWRAAPRLGRPPGRLRPWARAFSEMRFRFRPRPSSVTLTELAEHSELYYGVPHRVIARQQGSVAGDEEAVLVADLDLDQRRDWLELFPFLLTRRPDS